MPSLDGIRGLGMLTILMFHAGHIRGGFLAIEAFFGLSGFLITSLLLSEHAKHGSVGLGAFWARRVRRLLPAILALLGGIVLYAVVFAAADELETVRRDALATLGYVANWNAVADGRDYWELFQSPSPLEHTWTLAIEEQFYLIWPILFVGVFAWKYGNPKVLFGICVSLAVASTAWMWFLYSPDESTQRLYMGTDTRATVFLAGCALACLLFWRGETTSRRGKLLLNGAAIVSVVVMAFMWLFLTGESPLAYRGGMFLHTIPLLIVIAAAAHSHSGPVSRFLSFRPFVWIGLISYGVYLWHWPLFVVLDEQRTGLDGWSLTAVRLAVSLAVGVGSYWLIEMPVRKGALPGWRIKALLPAAGLGVAVLLVISTAGAKTTTQLAFQGAEDAAAAAESGEAPPPPPDVASPDDPPRVMVVGDSVGVFLGIAMKDREEDLGVVSHNIAEGGCIFTEGAEQMRSPQVGGVEVIEPAEHCTDNWTAATEEFRPDVVFAAFGGGARSDPEVDGEFLVPCTPEYATWYNAQFSASIDELTATGATVVIATTPHWEAGEFQGRGDVESWLDIVNSRIDCIDALNVDVARSNPSVELVDLREFACPGDECLEELDGVKLREDGVHFQGEAATIVNAWVVPQLIDAIPAGPPPAAETQL